MFFDYLALVILIIGLTLVFYTFIYIHDLPYMVAKKRHHPHKDAIHVACWLSLFTLHAIWPIVYIWAMTSKPPAEGEQPAPAPGQPDDVHARLARLEQRLKLAGVPEADAQ
jgi:hypothetical protein